MNDEQNLRLQDTCLHLRHKMMYVDARQTAFGRVDDSSDTRVFHCARTYEVLGPDGHHCSPTDCSPSRACYCSSNPSPQS